MSPCEVYENVDRIPCSDLDITFQVSCTLLSFLSEDFKPPLINSIEVLHRVSFRISEFRFPVFSISALK